MEHKNFFFDFWGTGEQANLFQENKGTGTPWEGLNSGEQEKKIHYSREGRIDSLVMQNGDPRDGFFYPTLTLMIVT